MSLTKLQATLIPFVTVCLILGVSIVVIAFGRGYRLDFQKTSVKPTGIVSATSDPTAAQIFVDGKLKSGTNNSFAIDPGWYTVRMTKDGYIGWEKRLRVQGEVVTRADAFLFPTNPSLSPLTTIGVVSPVLSPDGSKIAYVVPHQPKAGLWVLELTDRPLGRNRDPQQVAESTNIFDFTNSKLAWSPDSTDLMVTSGSTIRLYQSRPNSTFTDISGTVATTLKDWSTDKETKDRQKLAAFPPAFIDMASSSAKIISFSPDETKVLYETTASATLPQIITPALIGTNPTEEQRTVTPGKLYIYDSREDKNFFLLDKPYPLFWFPTNRHLILSQDGKIDIMEYDRTNWITIYSGPFVDSFVVPWPNATRIIILTNLNPGASTFPNLYTINLR